MARYRGRGQQFDKLWGRFNELDEIHWNGTRDISYDLDELEKKVQTKNPVSDYEIKDKRTLLGQIALLRVRERQKQEESEEKVQND